MIIEYAGFALLRPFWLLGLALAVAVALAAIRGAGGVGDWRRAVDAHLLDAMARRGGLVAGRGRGALAAALAVGALSLALAGPAIEVSRSETFRNLDMTVIAIDLSRSIAEGPQLQDLKIEALALAQAAGSRQIGVIAYAGDAYLVTPPTADRDGLETTLFALDGETTPEPGSAPSRALALARKTLRDAGAVGGDVVLMSDGGGIDQGTRGEAQGLAAEGRTLHTLFVMPSAAASSDPKSPGRPELEALAQLGGGATGAIGNAERIHSALLGRTAQRLGQGAFSSLAWYDFGRWLLLAAAVPMLLLFRRGG
jgi:Ca-activated chloride channel family protein